MEIMGTCVTDLADRGYAVGVQQFVCRQRYK